MHLPASLRALFGGLAADLDDPEVREILISGPGKVYLVRNGSREPSKETFTDARIRALADRLRRLGGPALGEAHRFEVAGPSRGEHCPIVQVSRTQTYTLSLARIAEKGGIDGSALSLLLGTANNVCGLVVAGPRGSGKTAILAALAREWAHKKKIAALDSPTGPLAAAAHLVLDRSRGIGDALRLGADAIVIDDPNLHEWHALLGSSRPFLASLEADGAQTALSRLVARYLSADPSCSRTAAEAVVESSVDLILELGRERDVPRVRGIVEPARERGILIGRPVLAERRAGSFVALNEAGPAHPRAGVMAIETTPPATTPRNSRLLRRKTTVPGLPVPPPSQPEATPALGTRVPSVRAAPILPPPIETNPLQVLDRLVATGGTVLPDLYPMTGAAKTMELGAASLPLHASPPIEASGEHSFESSELSEIRAEQLVSHSFVYNIASLSIPDEVNSDVVLIDKTEQREQDADLGHRESRNGAFHEDPRDSQDLHGTADLPPPSPEPVLETLTGQAGLPATTGRSSPGMSEAHRTRREAQERTPTVINMSHAADMLKGEPTIGPDEWAAAELLRHTSGPIDLAAHGDGEPITSAHPDIEPADLLTGSLSAQVADSDQDQELASSDLDNTQSALVSEMVSSFDGPSYLGEDDLAIFQTINPDADGTKGSLSGANALQGIVSLADNETAGAAPHDPTADLEPVERTGHFEEDTPYSPLVDNRPHPERVTLPEISGGIDPKNAAVVSGEEFDAMIDELRDVTRSGFSEEEEMTENRAGGDRRAAPGGPASPDRDPLDAEAPVKRAKILPDLKRQRRLR